MFPRSTRVRIVLIVLGCLVVLMGLSGLGFYWLYVSPRRALMSEDFPQKTSSEQRKILHSVLAWPGGHHDAYIRLIHVGDEASVPILIRSLKWQPHSSDVIMDCTKSHCLEALRTITNNDPGIEYEDWKEWWDKNGEKSREEWILLGFAAGNLPVSNPPDDKFICALIQALVDAREYFSKNAWLILSRVSTDQLLTCIDRCMRSESQLERRGAVVALAKLNTPDSLSRLRSMTSDQNPDVREFALSQLNAVLRKNMSKSASNLVLWKGKPAEKLTAVGTGVDGNRLLTDSEMKILMGSGSRLFEFDLTEKQVRWSFACSDVIKSVPVVKDDRVFFYCRDGTVYCLNARDGSLIWQRLTEGHYWPNKLLIIDKAVVVTENSFLWAFHREDGHTLWKLKIEPVIGSVCFTSGFIYVLTDDAELLKISLEGNIILKREIGETARSLSALDDIICVLSGTDTAHLTAYSGSSLSILWQEQIGKIWNWPQDAPAQDSAVVLACADDHVVALNRSSGKRLWSVADEADSPIYLLGNKFLIENSHGQLEIRDTYSGEVKTVYVQPFVHGRPLYVSAKVIASGGMDGNLWILKVPEDD